MRGHRGVRHARWSATGGPPGSPAPGGGPSRGLAGAPRPGPRRGSGTALAARDPSPPEPSPAARSSVALVRVVLGRVVLGRVVLGRVVLGRVALALVALARVVGAISGAAAPRFGFAAFRPHQQAVCEAAAAGEDVLLVMPTGAGKSLCYQLPGLARGGTTLVVSPLIALMEDQVAKLQAQGLRAERIHSGRGRLESRRVCNEYLAGDLDFLFIAPERLGVPGFPELLAKPHAHPRRRRRGALHLAVGPRLPPRLPPARRAAARCCAPRRSWRSPPPPRRSCRRTSSRSWACGPRAKRSSTASAATTSPSRCSRSPRTARGSARPARGSSEPGAAARHRLRAHPQDRRGRRRSAGRDPARRRRTTRASRAERPRPPRRPRSSRASSTWWSPPSPSAWASTRRTCAPCCTSRSRAASRPTTRRSAAPAATGSPSRAVLLHHFVDRKTHEFFLERDYPDAAVLKKVRAGAQRRAARLRHRAPPGARHDRRLREGAGEAVDPRRREGRHRGPAHRGPRRLGRALRRAAAPARRAARARRPLRREPSLPHGLAGATLRRPGRRRDALRRLRRLCAPAAGLGRLAAPHAREPAEAPRAARKRSGTGSKGRSGSGSDGRSGSGSEGWGGSGNEGRSGAGSKGRAAPGAGSGAAATSGSAAARARGGARRSSCRSRGQPRRWSRRCAPGGWRRRAAGGCRRSGC